MRAEIEDEMAMVKDTRKERTRFGDAWNSAWLVPGCEAGKSHVLPITTAICMYKICSYV